MVGDRGEPFRHADNDRLTQLIQANSVDLLNYFLRRAAEAEDAADLLSETMFATWRRIRSLPEDDERARMWMFGTARRLLANHYRGLRRKSALAERLRSEITHAELVAGVKEHHFAHVLKAVMALPAKQREVVALVHWDGFSLAEVAGILGASPSTVRGRYATARATLSRVLSPDRTPQADAPEQISASSSLRV